MSPSNKDKFREIKKTFGRFLSILLIVAVGVGFYTGVKSTSPSMYSSAEEYFNRQSLMDLGILSSVGFDDGDVEKIREIAHVDKVMPAYSADLVTKSDGEALVARVMSLPAEGGDGINVPYIIEGRLPESEDECLLTKNDLLECNLQLGDDIVFEPEAGDDDVDSILKQRTFHIVGIAELPQYISYTYGTASVGSGMIAIAVMIPQSNFLYSRYTEMYITLDCHANGISAFDDEYKPMVDEVSAALEELGVTQYSAFLKDMESQLEDAESEYEDGRQESENQLDASLTELNEAKQQIDDGLKQLESGWAEYDVNSKEFQNQIQSAQSQINQAKNALDNGWKKWNASQAEYLASKKKAQDELSAARQKLDDGWEQYNASKQEYDTAYEEYSQALANYQETCAAYEAIKNGETPSGNYAWILNYGPLIENYLENTKEELDATEAELAKSNDELNAAHAELMRSEEEYQENKASAEAQLAGAEAQLNASRAELESSQKEIQAAEDKLSKMKAQTQSQLDEARNELTNSESELATAQEQYNTGLDEYNKAVSDVEEELSDAKNRIQMARSDLHSVESGKWYVLDRDTAILGFSGYKSDAKRVDTIANVFAVFFMLVAILVCMSNMTRMVSEQRINIGTYKALGYRTGKIASKYLIYAALASAGGCILGSLVFIPITPPTIFAAYDMVYMLPEFNVTPSIWALVIAISVAMLSTILVTWFTCRKELRSSAASLMRPKSPPAGKKILLERIPFLWKCFSFFQKLTARNIFRYKMRLMMTVIGIAGCMALVVSGFGMKYAMVDITDIQYNDIEFEDMLISFDSEYSYEDIQEETDRIAADERLDKTLLMLKEDCVVFDTEKSESLADTYLYMPHDTTQAGDLVDLHNPKTKAPVSWSDEGVIVTEKIARNMGADIGDEIIIRIGEEDCTVKIAGIAECYVYNYVFMTPTYYETIMGTEPVYNSIYASESDKMIDRKEFSTDWLKNSDKVITILNTSTIRKAIDDSMYGMEYIVLFMIVCAGILACIVLYNLTNTNLSERMREIATVKVLGFNKREVNMYVFRDNLIMSVIGILLGSLLGWWLTLYLVKAVEVSMLTFIMSVAPKCYLYSAGITMAFTLIINLFMTRRLRSISMVESLKAVE